MVVIVVVLFLVVAAQVIYNNFLANIPKNCVDEQPYCVIFLPSAASF